MVAEAIAEELGVTATALREAKDITAKRVAVGYWVRRAKPDPACIELLTSLEGKEIFLFGTLGMWPDSDYARRCLANARALVEEKNVVLGEFLCQGKVDPVLRERCKKLPPGDPHALTPEKIRRHEEAAKHPNEADLAAARAAARRAFGR